MVGAKVSTRVVLAVSLGLLLASQATAQEVYKRRDASGRVVYSDRPPSPGEKAEPLHIQRQTEDWPGFAVLTTDPNGLLERLAPVAMPLILHAEDHERWLTADWRDAEHLVTPFPSHLMAVDDTYPYP